MKNNHRFMNKNYSYFTMGLIAVSLGCDEWAFFQGTCGQEKPTQSKSSTEADKPVSAGSK